MESFRKTVWAWKISAILSWTYAAFGIAYYAVQIIIPHYFHPIFSLISAIFLFLPIVLYLSCLTIVPQHYSTLSLKDFCRRVLFYLSQFLWFAITLMSFFSIKQSLIFALIATLFLRKRLLFSIQIIYSRQNRVYEYINSLDKDELIATGYQMAILLTITLPFSIKGSLAIPLIYAFTYAYIHLANVVVGEPTSCANEKSQRLIQCIKSNDPILQYWAISDLLESAKDKSLSRHKFVFDDETGEVFKNICEAIGDHVFKRYSNYHDMILNTTTKNASLTRLNDPTFSRIDYAPSKFINIQNSFDINAFIRNLPSNLKQIAMHPIQNIFVKPVMRYRSWSSTRNNYRIRLIKENDAAYLSITVIKSVEALVRFLFLTNEDRLGVVQVNVHQITDQFLQVLRYMKNTGDLNWITPDFQPKWIVPSIKELITRVQKAMEWANEQIVENFWEQIDVEKFDRQNAEFGHDFARRILSKQ